MREGLFRTWAHAIHGLAESTINSRVSNCKWVEKNVENLDAAFDRNRCTDVFEVLSYHDGTPHQLTSLINGDPYTNLAMYRSAVNLYVEFRTWLLHNSIESLLNEPAADGKRHASPSLNSPSVGTVQSAQPETPQIGRGEIADLWHTYSEALNALISALGRSSNVLGEISELLVARVHNGTLLPASEKSADVRLQDGTRIQVKSRVLRQGPATSLGIIRSWDFDLLAILLFSPDGSLYFAGEVSSADARRLAKHNEWQNGWVITTTRDVYHDPAVHDLTNQYRKVFETL